MISTAKKLMYDISGQSCPSDSFKIQVQDKSMDEYPEIIKWGLSENLIGLIEEYIKGKIKYRGVVFRKDFNNGKESDTRLWHYDDEDYRMIKKIGRAHV